MVIIQEPNEILRRIAAEIPKEDITSDRVKKVIAEMSEALYSQNDGVAIAAPQIAVSLRIFLVSQRVFAEGEDEMKEYAKEPPLVFINPVIIKLSRKKEMMEEGCLSVRFKYGLVLRHTKVTVEAYDQDGKKINRGASGLLAQIFQHETDHLDGKLFIDKASNIEENPPSTDNHE